MARWVDTVLGGIAGAGRGVRENSELEFSQELRRLQMESVDEDRKSRIDDRKRLSELRDTQIADKKRQETDDIRKRLERREQAATARRILRTMPQRMKHYPDLDVDDADDETVLSLMERLGPRVSAQNPYTDDEGFTPYQRERLSNERRGLNLRERESEDRSERERNEMRSARLDELAQAAAGDAGDVETIASAMANMSVADPKWKKMYNTYGWSTPDFKAAARRYVDRITARVGPGDERSGEPSPTVIRTPPAATRRQQTSQQGATTGKGKRPLTKAEKEAILFGGGNKR